MVNIERNIPMGTVYNPWQNVDSQQTSRGVIKDAHSGCLLLCLWSQTLSLEEYVLTVSVAMWCGLTLSIPICHRSMVSIWVESFITQKLIVVRIVSRFIWCIAYTLKRIRIFELYPTQKTLVDKNFIDEIF